MKEEISTKFAPLAIGPYSQAVKLHNLIFLSGQIPLHPETALVTGTTIAEQSRQVLDNISAILQSQGLTTHHVIKSTVFLTDLNHFQEFNKIYEEYFAPPYPARTTIEVSKLPKDSLIEIEVIVGIPT